MYYKNATQYCESVNCFMFPNEFVWRKATLCAYQRFWEWIKDHFNIYEIFSIQVWTASFLSYLSLTLELFFYSVLKKKKKKKKKKKWPDCLTCLLRNLYAGQETTIRTGHGTTGSELGKEYNKAICCHPAYLTYMQRASCKILGWMNHKLESRFLGKISTSHRQMISL